MLPQTLAFGDFRLDSTRRRLIRNGAFTSLPERMFGVLSLLLQSNGAVVDKERFATAVWPDSVMTDSNLAQHIYKLRRLLGENARHREYITTASGRGYRFAVPVLVERAYPNGSMRILDAHATLLKGGLGTLVLHARACHEFDRGSFGALRHAIELFRAVLEGDPGHAPALIGVARANLQLAQASLVAPGPAFKKAYDSLAQALELSPDSPSARAARAELLAFGQWDWGGARREIDIATRLDPSSTCVRTIRARLHLRAGSYDQALAEIQLALMTDPCALSLVLLVGEVFVHAARYRDAIGVLSTLLEGDSTIPFARRLRAQVYLLDRQPARAVKDLELL